MCRPNIGAHLLILTVLGYNRKTKPISSIPTTKLLKETSKSKLVLRPAIFQFLLNEVGPSSAHSLKSVYTIIFGGDN